MDVNFRPIEPDEFGAFSHAVSTGFGEAGTWFERGKDFAEHELERTLCGFEGDTIVSGSRNYSFELTVPGPAIVRAAGLSAVAVLPTHRRRGLLRQMITRLFDEAVEHGEVVSMLTASEASIYERFGYGVSTRSATVRLERRELEFTRPRPPGRLRLIDADEARKIEPQLFDRVRRVYPGAISRPDEWWCEQFVPELGTRFDVLYESDSGDVEGYCAYGIKERWNDMGGNHLLTARDFVAATPPATHALWRYLCEVDLVGTIVHRAMPVDSPIPWLLASSRAVHVERLADYVWTRLLDVPATLGARTYAASDRIVLEIHDEVRPGGAADGTFAVEGGPEGATVARVHGGADLTCGVAAASAAWLGDVRWSELAAASLVDEHTPGALARADAMFASTPLPHPYTWF